MSSTTESSTEKPQLDSFPQFSNLPIELREQIWKKMIRPRTINLDTRTAEFKRAHQKLAVLFVNKESRDVVGKEYIVMNPNRKSFAGLCCFKKKLNLQWKPVHFNVKLDTPHFELPDGLERVMNTMLVPMEVLRQFREHYELRDFERTFTQVYKNRVEYNKVRERHSLQKLELVVHPINQGSFELRFEIFYPDGGPFSSCRKLQSVSVVKRGGRVEIESMKERWRVGEILRYAFAKAMEDKEKAFEIPVVEFPQEFDKDREALEERNPRFTLKHISS